MAIVDFRRPDPALLATSILAFAAAFLFPIMVELFLGSPNLITEVWGMPGVAFHEVGHVLFHVIASPITSAIGLWSAYPNTPLTYLGGFLFNSIAGVLLLWFSFALQSRLDCGKLREDYRVLIFSFMVIAYSNLFMSSHTVFHLEHGHVVGEGLDFTTAAFQLSITLDELARQMTLVFWAAAAIAVLLNFIFLFRGPRWDDEEYNGAPPPM
ncbi:MAG: hypothetical protein NTW59_03660 [Candidatus Diapherotrites archaeon]|nr:hypothetical protein [Candidatus Diapherotrites archaeon]